MALYTEDVHIRFSPEEREVIERRMNEAGIKNMSAYVRKIAVDGLVVKRDAITK